MALVAVYWVLAYRENKKRDASGIMEGFDHAFEDDLTDKKVRQPEPWTLSGNEYDY